MAPSDVKQSFLTPSLKLMVYLMIVRKYRLDEAWSLLVTVLLILYFVGNKSHLRHLHFQVLEVDGLTTKS
jgi:hypothetical protein